MESFGNEKSAGPWTATDMERSVKARMVTALGIELDGVIGLVLPLRCYTNIRLYFFSVSSSIIDSCSLIYYAACSRSNPSGTQLIAQLSWENTCLETGQTIVREHCQFAYQDGTCHNRQCRRNRMIGPLCYVSSSSGDAST